jgi:translation initiation factor 5B
LFDDFVKYVKKCKDDRKTEEGTKAVFPCILEVVRGAVFNSRQPIVIGVTVKAGVLKIGSPLCVPDKAVIIISHLIYIIFVEHEDRSHRLHGNK